MTTRAGHCQPQKLPSLIAGPTALNLPCYSTSTVTQCKPSLEQYIGLTGFTDKAICQNVRLLGCVNKTPLATIYKHHFPNTLKVGMQVMAIWNTKG